ncbi:hypothetical protein GCM10010415_56170 [Streptomyces atrovirens]
MYNTTKLIYRQLAKPVNTGGPVRVPPDEGGARPAAPPDMSESKGITHALKRASLGAR